MAGRGGGRGDVRGDGVVGRRTSSSGRGFALDLGFGVLMNGWEAGVGINGIANRIDWTGVQERSSALGHLFIGDDLFVRTPPAPVADERVALPVDYRLNAGRHSERWSAVAEYGHGFQRSSFRAGAEYRLGPLDVRGGAIYSRERWHPTGGLGFDVTPRVALDVAAFGTSANVERETRAALAASIRINRF